MRWHYFLHLVGWAGPLIALQWAVGWRVFRRSLGAVFGPAFIATVFFGVTDSLAVRDRLWFFDERQILGWRIGILPVEEVLFFLLTSLLVTQSFVLLLPRNYRREESPAGRFSSKSARQ